MNKLHLKIIYSLILVILLSSEFVIGQSQDSIQFIYQEAVKKMETGEFEKSEALLRSYLELANDTAANRLKAYQLMTQVYTYIPNLKLALVYSDSFLIQPNLSKYNIINANIDRANIFYQGLSMDSAANYYFKALELQPESSIQIQLYENLANVFNRMGDDQQSAKYLNLGFEIATSLRDTFQLISLYNQASITYKDQPDTSFYLSKKAVELLKSTNKIHEAAITYLNLGVAYQSILEFDSAEHYHLLSLEYFKQSGDLFGQIYSLVNIGLDQNIENNQDYKIWLDRAYQLADSANLAQEKSTTLEYYAYADSVFGDYHHALQAYVEHVQIQNQLKKDQQLAEIEEVRSKYDLDQQLKENELLAAKNELAELTISRQRNIVIALTILISIVALALYLINRQSNINKKLNSELEVKNKRIENLMRELHHRVKNNLQVISSLLGLHSMKIQNEEAQKMVSEGKERIRAMALIHQKLYQQEEVSSVNMKEYIENLVSELSQSYGFQNKAEIKLDLIDISLDADTSLPVGLIINEVVSNAFKYAYRDIEKPILELKLLQSDAGKYSLSIKDNGVGLPDSFNINETQSFGLRLVNILSRQIKGHVEVINKNGLEYQLTF